MRHLFQIESNTVLTNKATNGNKEPIIAMIKVVKSERIIKLLKEKKIS
ncbi:MAG: hypothetical protein IMY72_06555 [Bacteroidetes bacterium]|nr:hypothetical protein [Bacteroidota bacterium]